MRQVNKKTVTVPNHIITTPRPGDREYTDTTPWREVRDHLITDQMPSAFVDAYEEPGRERFRLTLSDFQDGTS